MTDTNDELLTYPVAATLLGLRLGTLYGLVSKRQIPHIRINKRIVRFSKQDLLKFINERRFQFRNEPETLVFK